MKFSFDASHFLEILYILSHSIIFLHFWHCSLRKAFFSLRATLWNCAFKLVYLSFSPCLLLFFFSQLFVRPSQTTILPFLHFFSLGMFLATSSCTVWQTSVRSSSGILSIRSNPLKLFVISTVQWLGIWLRSYLNGLVVFPTFFNLSGYAECLMWNARFDQDLDQAGIKIVGTILITLDMQMTAPLLQKVSRTKEPFD